MCGSSNWIYSYFESLTIYSIIFSSSSISFFPSDDSFDFFFFFFFSRVWGNYHWTLKFFGNYHLFWSVILDNYLNFSLLKNYFSDEWFYFLLNSKYNGFFLIFHPELFFIKSENLWDSTYLNISLYDVYNLQGFFLSIFLLPQLIFTLILISFFFSFYFSFYTSSVKEENTIDVDFLCASLTVEAEKEITAIDDIILAFIMIIYIFGWFFFSNCWSILLLIPDFSITFYVLPFFWITILCIPAFLLYDFGIYFVSYLRGVAPTALILAELMFDYINILAFFIRLLVQGVRMVLMLLTYISLHDFILFFFFDQNILFLNETVWNYLNNLNTTSNSISFFLISTLPGQIIYWVYELLHTFFVVIAQTTAFFAMVFWLFLFLYTFFVAEKQEAYFFEKRQQRRLFLDKLFFLKF